jgi:hypothetical protein
MQDWFDSHPVELTEDNLERRQLIEPEDG